MVPEINTVVLGLGFFSVAASLYEHALEELIQQTGVADRRY